MKKSVKIVLGVAVVVIVGGIVTIGMVKDEWARRTLERALTEEVGGDIAIGVVESNLLRSRVQVREMRFDNPRDIPLETVLEINALEVHYRPLSLMTSRVHLPEVTLDVQRVYLVLEEGESFDLRQLTRAPSSPHPRPEPALVLPASEQQPARDTPARTAKPTRETIKTSPVSTSDPREVHIDQLVFRLGTIEIDDRSRAGVEPVLRTYRLNLERTFTDVSDMDTVVQAILMDLAFAMGPQLLRETFSQNADVPKLLETIADHDGDLSELGEKLDTQTKELQRELRNQFRRLR